MAAGGGKVVLPATTTLWASHATVTGQQEGPWVSANHLTIKRSAYSDSSLIETANPGGDPRVCIGEVSILSQPAMLLARPWLIHVSAGPSQ